MGYVVRRLRAMRREGASVAELMAFVERRTPGRVFHSVEYIQRAFVPDEQLIYLFLPPQLAEVEALIDERAPEWQTQRFPELMRERDYFSFLEFAKHANAFVNVCGANPFSGRFVGRQGYRCYDGREFVVVRDRAPNEGLIAADPSDPRLGEALRGYARPLSYSEYVRRLRQRGYCVLGSEEGYVLEDAAGCRFYEGYRLHSVYDPETEQSRWTGKMGETLRADLNRRLGEELVRWGPHDDWVHRNDRDVAGPLWGPQSPLIEFTPEGDIENYLEFKELVANRGAERPWEQLYPHHVAAEEES